MNAKLIAIPLLALGVVGAVALAPSSNEPKGKITVNSREITPAADEYVPGDPLPAPPVIDKSAPEGTPVPTVAGPVGPIYPDGYVEQNDDKGEVAKETPGETVPVVTTLPRPPVVPTAPLPPINSGKP